MEQQLVVMGIRSNAKLDPSSNVVRVLIDMYVEIGGECRDDVCYGFDLI